MSLHPFPRAGGSKANHIALAEVRPLLFFIKLVHKTYSTVLSTELGVTLFIREETPLPLHRLPVYGTPFLLLT